MRVARLRRQLACRRYARRRAAEVGARRRQRQRPPLDAPSCAAAVAVQAPARASASSAARSRALSTSSTCPPSRLQPPPPPPSCQLAVVVPRCVVLACSTHNLSASRAACGALRGPAAARRACRARCRRPFDQPRTAARRAAPPFDISTSVSVRVTRRCGRRTRAHGPSASTLAGTPADAGAREGLDPGEPGQRNRHAARGSTGVEWSAPATGVEWQASFTLLRLVRLLARLTTHVTTY